MTILVRQQGWFGVSSVTKLFYFSLQLNNLPNKLSQEYNFSSGLHIIYGESGTGKSELIITSAKGSCGCTVPEWPKEPIMPGEEGQIRVKFNSDKKPNLQQKSITLVTNTEQGKEILKIKAQVTPKSKVQQNS